MSASRRSRSLAPRILILFLAGLLLLGAFGCSSDDGDDGGTTPTPDTTPPPEVTSFLALPADGQVTLSWTLPISNDLAGVQIRRAIDAAPTVTTGDVVYEGVVSPYVDSAVTNDQTYFYGAFTYDSSGNFSAGVTKSCMPRVGAGVTIADANLEEALRTELGVPSGDITDLQMETLLELTVPDAGIADLQGLQYAVNLHTLNLSYNELDNASNLQLLTQLVSLYYLDVSGNRFTILPDLSALTALERLVVFNCPITSLAPLSGVTSLVHLQFGYCGVSDLTPLQTLTALEFLGFRHCGVTSLAPLSGMGALTSLQVMYCDIPTIDTVATLPNLLDLELDNLGIDDVAPLSGLDQLRSLSLSSNEIDDLSPLSGLTSLTALRVGGNRIRDVSPIAGLTSLVTLGIGGNPILDISSLDGLPNLSSFNADQCWVSDVSVATNWDELTDLSLYGCSVGTESIENVLPVLTSAGVNVTFDYDADYLQLLGVWNISGITRNGAAVDPGAFFDWDPETVTNHLIVFPWSEYRTEDLDSDGLPVYYERGHLVVDGENLSVEPFEMDGEAIWPIEAVFTGTWARDGADLVFTQVDGDDTIVMTWVR